MDKKNGHNPDCRQGGHFISVRAPAAKVVFLAGTFNDWNPKSQPMKKTKSGEWVQTLDLPAGHYEYKFVIDGQWCCEPGRDKPYNGCPGCVPNQHGTMNRLLEVK